MPTMGCQESVSEPDSGSAPAGPPSQGHVRRAAMEAGGERNGEVQGRRPGLDCTQNGQIRRQERQAGAGRTGASR